MPNYFQILKIQGRRFQKQGAAWGHAAPSAFRDPLLHPTTHPAFAIGLSPSQTTVFAGQGGTPKELL